MKARKPKIDLEAVLSGSVNLDFGHDDLEDAAEVAPRSPRWYWRRRLVAGDLNILAGVQGVGKSQVAVAIAAEGTRAGESVLIISREDSTAEVIVPRLIAAGADRSEGKVHIWRQDRDWDLEQYEKFQDLVRAVDARLVVIDPVAAFVTAKTDTYKDAHVRQLLSPIRAVAENEDCTVLALMHLKKGSEAEAVNNVGGSIAWTAAPRSVLLVRRSEEVDGKRVLYHVKCNVGKEQPALEFTIEDVPFDTMGLFETSYVEWGSERDDLDVQAAFAPREDGRKTRATPALDHATEWLISYLLDAARNGRVVTSYELNRAREAEGIKDSTWEKARKAVDLKCDVVDGQYTVIGYSG